ncbi:GTP-binding protein [Candidatus Microgenomates bacterium]|nr:GTP-binding protein [Candidatus Microgenomates bacterium]
MKQKRQPIVTVLGHVDHGKTTLLDTIRETSVQIKEAGGITQAIGASVVTTKDGNKPGAGKKITFIDTPGHAAFSSMRSRGSKLADIAILILDGSDGVKPQTKEALELIKKAEIPFIVVITKTDLPTSSVDTRLAELEKEGIMFEGRGGQTPYLSVSAKEKKGLTELLDLIILLSEVNEVSSDPDADLVAVVIETNKDKSGNSVSVVVREGTLEKGDKIYTEGITGKARGLFDGNGESLEKVSPGEPVRILGFDELPPVGAIVSQGEPKEKVEEQIKSRGFDEGKIPLCIKAATAGALEALVSSIPPEFSVVVSGVGDVSESDVLNAKANNTRIMAFESKIPPSVAKLAEMDGVKVDTYKIIYELLQKLDEIVKSGQVDVLGKATIVDEFPFSQLRIAGCKVDSGKLSKTSDLRLMRKDVELGKIKAKSLKKQKSEVESVGQGEEFGLLFVPQLDFQKGDVVLSVQE